MKDNQIDSLVNGIVLASRKYNGFQLRFKINKLIVEALATETVEALRDLEAGELVSTNDVRVAARHTVEEYHKEHPEVRGRIVLDDPWKPSPGRISPERRKELYEDLQRVIDKRRDDGAPIMIIQSRVHDEDQPGYIELDPQEFDYPYLTLPLDDELDYSWLTPTRIRGAHPYTYRCGQWAEIIRIETLGERPCFKCRYEDGVCDFIPLCDLDNYETNPE